MRAVTVLVLGRDEAVVVTAAVSKTVVTSYGWC
jgi:hypothetical protein